MRFSAFLPPMACAVACCAFLFAAPVAIAQQAAPEFAQVRAAYRPSEARLVDRNGAPLAERRLHFDGFQRAWVRIDSLSPAMLEALLEAEDRRFYEHEGIDWRAFAAAAVQNLWFEHARGASTLTMQLAGMLEPALRPGVRGKRRRTLEQKWDQAVAAQALDAQWSKAQILETYLNLAPFRGELRGIGAAASVLVGKTPDALDRPEAAVLVALLRAPNAPLEKVIWRACELVTRIGTPEACERTREIARGLDPVRLSPRWQDAPHLARRLLSTPGEVVKTTLSRRWQRRMLEALRAAAPARAGLVVIDNASGAVLAEIGGLSPAHADATQYRYPAGRMLWPLISALAIDSERLTAATLLDAGAMANPRWVSVRAAMSRLRHTPLIDDLLGRAPADALAGALASTAIGVALSDLTRGDAWAAAPLDLTTLATLARALAIGGEWQPAFRRPGEREPVEALVSAPAAFVATDLFPVVWAAPVSAGHSAWAVGSNAEVSIAVWMETGPTALLEVRAWLVDQLALDGIWPPERVIPSGVTRRVVRFSPPVEAARPEWFLDGAVISVSEPPPLVARIVAPRAREIVDAHPSAGGGIVALRASKADPRLRWRLDGRWIGTGGQLEIVAEAGLRRLALYNERGEELDRVDFAVRSR